MRTHKAIIIGIFMLFLTFILNTLFVYSQSNVKLNPYIFNSPDKGELIEYMKEEIKTTYYWSENLVSFYMLDEPIGNVNFAAKSEAGDIYYFVWIQGVVPQLAAAEKSERIEQGKILAKERDEATAKTNKTKYRKLIDSLKITYEDSISQIILASPLDQKEKRIAEYHQELVSMYNDPWNQNPEHINAVGMFADDCNRYIFEEIQNDILEFKKQQEYLIEKQKDEKISEIHSLAGEMHRNLSYGQMSNDEFDELVLFLNENKNNIKYSKFDNLIDLLTSHAFFEYEYDNLIFQDNYQRTLNETVEDEYSQALELEKLYLLIKEFLESKGKI